MEMDLEDKPRGTLMLLPRSAEGHHSPSTSSSCPWCIKALLVSMVLEFVGLVVKGSPTFLIHSLTIVILRKLSESSSCYHRSAGVLTFLTNMESGMQQWYSGII